MSFHAENIYHICIRITLATLLCLGCDLLLPDTNADLSAQVDDSGTQITLGLMADLSGPNAANGEDCRRGYEAARYLFAPKDKTANHRINFVYGDHRGDPKTGISEFNRLAGPEQAWAIACNRSQIGMVVNPISAQRHIPLLGTVGQADFVSSNPFAWRFFPSADDEGRALAEKAIQLGHKRGAVIVLQDEWTLSLSQSFRHNFEKLGGRIVYHETLTPPENDLSSIVTRIKVAAPDAIMLSFLINDSGLVVRKLREQGLNQQIFANVYASKKEALDVAAGTSEGLIFSEPDLRKPHFNSALEAIFHDKSATAITYSCFAALATGLQVIAELPTGAGRRDFERGLFAQTEARLPDESLLISDREIKYKLVYKIIRNGQIEYM